MVSISRHCANIALQLIRIVGIDTSKLEIVYSWLRLASGLKSIEFNASLFDDGSSMYCGTAYYFDYQLEKTHERFVNKMTVFMYIWNAIEALYSFVQPLKLLKQHGKINRLCAYISSHNPNDMYLVGYLDVLDALHNVLSSTYWGASLKQITKPDFVNVNSYGLYLAYKIRCMAVHGDDLPPNGPYSHTERLSGASVFFACIKDFFIVHPKSFSLLGR